MNKSMFTVLVVDDTESNIDILLDILGEEYDISVALDGQTAIEIATSQKIDLILLDIMMPDMNGFDVCKVLKEQPTTKNIPIIFITSKTDENSIEEAYEIGGVDYVTKPFRYKELRARVKTHIDLKNLISHLDHIASYDMLTGLYNRRKFFELATNKFNQKKENLFAVMLDIDKFKLINDTYGHAVGDKVIQSVASIVDDFIGKMTVLGRLGGEEFAIVCNSNSIQNVFATIEQIRTTIDNAELLLDDGKVVKYTVSFGIASYKEEFKFIDHLLQEADKALYEAKGSGRNRTIFRYV